MVKGAARSGAAAQSSTPQQLPTMQAGQNPHDPLTQLNGPMGFGLMAGLNPFAELGLNPNDPNMVRPPFHVDNWAGWGRRSVGAGDTINIHHVKTASVQDTFYAGPLLLHLLLLQFHARFCH